MRYFLTLALLFAAFWGKSQDTHKVISIQIEPFKKVSNGAFFRVMTLHSPDCGVEYLDGFDFQWGYIYQLKVRETHLANPPMDGSSLKYTLIREISRTKAPEDYEFTLFLVRDLYLGGEVQKPILVRIDDHTCRYFDETYLLFSPEQEADLEQIMAGGKGRTGRFRFAEDGKIRLIGFD
ncbi:MAG: DUF4377 domain-containing protein [Bacteroidia bacterium]|nr:DUF4377 domain-containing protein [Bacteroidia bacterium]